MFASLCHILVRQSGVIVPCLLSDDGKCGGRCELPGRGLGPSQRCGAPGRRGRGLEVSPVAAPGPQGLALRRQRGWHRPRARWAGRRLPLPVGTAWPAWSTSSPYVHVPCTRGAARRAQPRELWGRGHSRPSAGLSWQLLEEAKDLGWVRAFLLLERGLGPLPGLTCSGGACGLFAGVCPALTHAELIVAGSALPLGGPAVVEWGLCTGPMWLEQSAQSLQVEGHLPAPWGCGGGTRLQADAWPRTWPRRCLRCGSCPPPGHFVTGTAPSRTRGSLLSPCGRAAPCGSAPPGSVGCSAGHRCACVLEAGPGFGARPRCWLR